MASYNIATIRANLKTLLTAVTGISYCYDYYNANIEGYPAIIFDVTNEEASMLDDSNNLRVITFSIYIYSEVQVSSQTTSRGKLDTIVASVINALELKSNDTLSGSVDWLMPVIGRRQELETTQGLVYMQELQLKCNVASSIL